MYGIDQLWPDGVHASSADMLKNIIYKYLKKVVYT